MPRKRNKKTPADLPVGMAASSQSTRQGPPSSGGARPRAEAPVEAPRQRLQTSEMTRQRGGQQASMEEEDVASGMKSLSVGDQPPESQPEETLRAVPPERLGFSSAESDRLISQFPRKPPSGRKVGRPITLVTNLFPLKHNSGCVYHYDVEILSVGKQSLTTQATKTAPADKKFRCLNSRQNREVFEKMMAENHLGLAKAAYDGRKNAIASRQLDLPKKSEFRVKLADREFVVQIKPVAKEGGGGCAIGLAEFPLPRESVAALEMVLKHKAALRFVPVFQNFFSPPERPMPLTPLSEMWRGHHQSVRMAERGPVVTLNTCASAFYKAAPLTLFFEKAFDLDSTGLHRLVWAQSGRKAVMVERQLRGMKVVTTYSNFERTWRVEGLTRDDAQNQTFPMDGERVRVADYLRDRYGVRLKYPNLPCVKVGARKDNYIPVELCTIMSGQRCKDRTLWNPEQMIKYATETPEQKFERIFEIRESKTKFDQDELLRAFQLTVDHRPLEVEGRTLNAPCVMYHESGDSTARPMFGSWNLRDRKFLEGASIRSWVLISFTNVNLKDLRDFAGAMSEFAPKQGMDMGRCQDFITERPPEKGRGKEALQSYLERVFKKLSSVQLAVVVIPDKDNKDLYTLSKLAADPVGVTVQCVQRKNVVTPPGKRGPSPSLVVNILAKVNEKMGGVNASLRPGEMPALMRDVMFVGADVTHPSPIGELPCSVVGVVATMDARFGTYAVKVRAQESKPNKQSREVIQDFQTIAEELLLEYKRRNKKLPKHVVVYRDGVSDGEIPIVQHEEVEALGRALHSFGIPTAHKTYIVVQKRHHVRMKPKNPRDGDRRTGNPPPGTMVDTTITHPFLYDFFMYPHNGLQGTSKPIYCIVVQDTSSIKPEDLYTMTYQLCHLFAPCTKSISSPAPIRYADKAAYVGRSRLEAQKDESRGPKEDDNIDFAAINERLADIDFKHVV